MSGLEIVVIIGAGYLITKKVQEHKKNKALKAAGLASADHGAATIVTPGQQRGGKQQQTNEEDQLPLYSPPSKEYTENGGLPTYDDLAKGPLVGSDIQQSGTTQQNTTGLLATSESSSLLVKEKGKQPSNGRWRKLLRRESKREPGQGAAVQ